MKVHGGGAWRLLSLGIGLLYYWHGLSAPATAAADQDSLHRGKILFERNCAGCHGLTGKGDGYKLLGPDPANLTAPSTSEKADEDLLRTIHEGKPNMPAWKPQLSSAKIHDVLEYVRSLSK
ncbi:MAG TPA: c-type cytochrome [Nitrospira sp.]|nr:c-type cytochrome [Nitrospira sp.]